MALVRTIFALLIAVSVAMLPAAGAAAFKVQPQEPPEMSASEPMHDCCPPTANPCDRADDCGSMATCALQYGVYLADVTSPLVYPRMLADLIALLPSGALPSQLGSPPFRPPRV
jgi:hypothetical protein